MSRPSQEGTADRRPVVVIVVLAASALAIGGLALTLQLIRAPAGPTSVYSATFVIGAIGHCDDILGWSGYCDMINLTLPGGHESNRLVLLEVTLNQSCPTSCVAELGSYPRNSSSFEGFDTGSFLQAQSSGGVLWGGPYWLQVTESTYCGNPSGCPHYSPLTATINVYDYGQVPG